MRNLLHYLIGAVIGILLFLTFDGVPFAIQILITAFIMGVIGTMWEWGWQMYNKSFIDYMDVLRGAIGALLTVLILNLWIK
jgi:hypothetical protein